MYVQSTEERFWQHVDRVIDSAPSPTALRMHGLGALAAWRYRERGLPVPELLESAARGAGFAAVTAAPLLQRVRDTIDGPIIVLKGPEVAAYYPKPALRSFGDLDLLVEDVGRAEAQLRASGFSLAEMPIGKVHDHHDSPLFFPGSAVSVELHYHPGFLTWMTPPSNLQLFSRAVPCSVGVEGVGALPRAEHSLLLAAHSWRHAPLRSWHDLIDIALAREAVDEEAMCKIAREFGMEHLWSLTTRAINWYVLQSGNAPKFSHTIWARHLLRWNERNRIEWWVAKGFAGLAADSASVRIRTIAGDFWENLIVPAKYLPQR